ncbi:MAG: hypothetical protein BGO43_13565 [Gammaproteobacteria bacterium 39-13]|nr:hypothetical protein [Gammaproteobacteria bacterium]OJV94774.1 MAG: hypothetical protein BGO43_13565 [Gammaproteobacteria bacterium 39-13]
MTDAQIVKIKQIALFAGLLGALTLLIHSFLSWTVGKPNAAQDKRAVIQAIPSITKNIDDSSIWMQRIEGKLKNSEKRNAELEKELEGQRVQMDAIIKGQEILLEEMSQKLEFISQQAAEQQENTNQLDKNMQNHNAWPPGENTTDEFAYGAGNPPAIFSTSLKLSEKNKNLKINYIPAGTFVRAVILGGVDASASISSQSEPRPVLLRLVDLGVLPNHARANIQDCHIIAAVYGDISSERAYARTERISCTLKNGKVFESSLEGYIAGEDGKDGVRGKVIRREGDLLWNSFFAGAVSGLGKGMSQGLGTTSISPLGSTTTTTGSDVLKSGAYSGIGEGADRLQKYFIERAEQYQPVIQIAAGREITVVFTKGLTLDGIKL